jgi:FlaA1/EpsC-like NDP-sugar epimerase
METTREIIAVMKAAAPPGQADLPADQLEKLTSLTTQLVAADDGTAKAELERFRSVRYRRLPMAPPLDWLKGQRVLVTGGTGCVGSRLVRELADHTEAEHIASFARGETQPSPHLYTPESCYINGDIRCPPDLDRAFQRVNPTVVFHVAGQRDPGLAEKEVRHTVSTNIIGTQRVLEACERHNVERFVFAGTGKALRPYSTETYTATKRIAEWLVHAAGRRGLTVAGTRFTHVVDNSIVYHRLRDSVYPLRIHDPDIAFYVQSAVECAQLLLIAGARAEAGTFRIHSITDLDWPVSLLSLAIGTLAVREKEIVPIYLSGYDPGYEKAPYPGLYDPKFSGNITPLFNSAEGALSEQDTVHGTDSFPVDYGGSPVPALSYVEAATTESDATLALARLATHAMHASLAAIPHPLVNRMATLAAGHELPPSQQLLGATVAAYGAGERDG